MSDSESIQQRGERRKYLLRQSDYGAYRAGFNCFPALSAPTAPALHGPLVAPVGAYAPVADPAGRTGVQRSGSPGLRATRWGLQWATSSPHRPTAPSRCCSPRKPGARQSGGTVHLRKLADREPANRFSRQPALRLPGRSVCRSASAAPSIFEVATSGAVSSTI